MEKNLQALSWVQAIPEHEELQAGTVCQGSITTRFPLLKLSPRHLLLTSVRDTYMWTKPKKPHVLELQESQDLMLWGSILEDM